MSLNKNEFEYLRLYAQKCDHRHPVAPVASFGLAAGLRAHNDRAGRMFEKRRERSDKYVIDESHNEPVRSRAVSYPGGPQPFAPHPAPWRPVRGRALRPTDLHLMDHLNRNEAQDPEKNENLSDEQRLHKLYRILGYRPPQELSKPKPMKAPKVDLKSSPRVPAVYGKSFNRNARGWCVATDDVLQQADPASQPVHVTVDDAGNHYYYYPADYSPEERELFKYGNYRPRPKSWHSVHPGSVGPGEDQVPAGDYNPRPKAWAPGWDEVDLTRPRGELLLTGDFNPRPKPWLGEGEAQHLSPTRGVEVPAGDYNPRPKAWRSNHRGKGRSKSQPRLGDYNARPEPWQSSGRGHFRPQEKDGEDGQQSQPKFGDYNARAKAWKASNKGHHPGKAKSGDYNPRPKAWRAPPKEDDSSSSYTSSDYSDEEEDYDSFYSSTLYSRSSIPACDV